MEMESYKQVYYSDDTFSFGYEIYDQRAFLHCEVKEWKPSVYKKLCSVLNSFLVRGEKAGLKGVYTITPNPKFCELFGGVFVNTIRVDGKEYEVFKWELK